MDLSKELMEEYNKIKKENSIEHKQHFQQKILNIDYEPSAMCQRCVFNHVKNKNLDFDIDCKPIPQKIEEKKPEDFDTFEDYYYYKVMTDVDFFAKHELNLELRSFQREMLKCTQNRKVLRLPRRQGKSIYMVLAMLHFILVNEKKRVLILQPTDTQVKQLVEDLEKMIKESPILSQLVQQPRSSSLLFKSTPFYQFTFKNGSIIKGLTTGNQDGKTARGQGADLLVFDETQYISENAINQIIPILNDKEDVKLIAASTPADAKGYYYELCNSKSVKEVYYKYHDIKEIYKPKLDEEFKDRLTDESYKKEVLAEFTTTGDSVFPMRIITPNLRDYSFDKIEYGIEPQIYTFGIDWNESSAGTHIVILKHNQKENNLIVSNIVIVPPSEFTQLKALETIIKLNEIYNPVRIAQDEGYGNTQLQFLRKYGLENPQSKIKDRLMTVNFGSKIKTHIVGGGYTQQQIKPLMVSVTSRYLEENKLVLPKSENKQHGLIHQMKNYEQVGLSEGNVPKYSKGYVHTLESLFLQVWAMWLLSPDQDDFGFNQDKSSQVGGFKKTIKKVKKQNNYTSNNNLNKTRSPFRRRRYI